MSQDERGIVYAKSGSLVKKLKYALNIHVWHEGSGQFSQRTQLSTRGSIREIPGKGGGEEGGS